MNKPWDIEGKWSISHFGWADEVRKTMPLLPKKVGLRDVTFREGDDCVGYLVSVEDKLEMLRLAVEMGVEEIDIGGPSMHQHQFDFGKAVQKSGIKVRTTGRFFANNTKDYKRDVDMCVEAGSTNIRIVLMYLNEETIYNQLKVFPKMVEYCHSQQEGGHLGNLRYAARQSGTGHEGVPGRARRGRGQGDDHGHLRRGQCGRR